MPQSFAEHPAHSLDWNSIECVFLDMDGTLLDLNYDNHVWNDLVPQAYALQSGLSLAEAKASLLQHMRKIHGTIEFYSFEYWTDYTGVDLIATHQAATDLVDYRPGALEFLRWLKRQGCAGLIATNAHPHSIRVKDAYVGIKDVPWLGTVVMGNQKVPFGLDALRMSDIYFCAFLQPARMWPCKCGERARTTENFRPSESSCLHTKRARPKQRRSAGRRSRQRYA